MIIVVVCYADVYAVPIPLLRCTRGCYIICDSLFRQSSNHAQHVSSISLMDDMVREVNISRKNSQAFRRFLYKNDYFHTLTTLSNP